MVPQVLVFVSLLVLDVAAIFLNPQMLILTNSSFKLFRLGSSFSIYHQIGMQIGCDLERAIQERIPRRRVKSKLPNRMFLSGSTKLVFKL